MDRRTVMVLLVLAVVVLALFLIAGALDPPARLRTRPPTATPKGGIATVAQR